MIRAGLSGTNWTGKTTLINKLTKSSSISDMDVISLSDIVTKCPYPIDQQQTLDASEWVIKQIKHREATLSEDLRIVWYDRTPLDILAFTLYAFDRFHEEASKIRFERLRDELLEMLEDFQIIFFLTRGNSWPPVLAPEKAVRHAELMEDYLKRARAVVSPVVKELPQSLADRLKCLQEFQTQSIG